MISAPILVQQHYAGTTFFDRDWDEYKKGFGDRCCNYWIGNDLLYTLTRSDLYSMRIDVIAQYGGRRYWAEYRTFRVDDEATGYRLHVGGYSGTAGDSFTMSYESLNGTKFSSRDRDNDMDVFRHCAALDNEGAGSGFWYHSCGRVFVNAPANATWGFVLAELPVGTRIPEDRKLLYSKMTLFTK